MHLGGGGGASVGSKGRHGHERKWTTALVVGAVCVVLLFLWWTGPPSRAAPGLSFEGMKVLFVLDRDTGAGGAADDETLLAKKLAFISRQVAALEERQRQNLAQLGLPVAHDDDSKAAQSPVTPKPIEKPAAGGVAPILSPSAAAVTETAKTKKETTKGAAGEEASVEKWADKKKKKKKTPRISFVDDTDESEDANEGRRIYKRHTGPRELPSGDENPTLPVRWYGPFFSGGGYCVEAIGFVTSLRYITPFQVFQLGDSIRQQFVDGLERKTLETLKTMQDTHLPPEKSISVCHTPANRWEPALYTPAEAICPAPGALYKVGRTMYESDGLPDVWVERLNKMDRIWVPTHFNYRTFKRAGVKKQKLRVVPEAVDVDLFNPKKTLPSLLVQKDKGSFCFLSVFKWEERKGWRFLLQAFLEEFSNQDRATLYILTNQDRHSTKMQSQMAKLYSSLSLGKSPEQLPEIRFLPKNIPQQQMPGIYMAADAFVLPSRGEGFGRPHVEAMSMGLPVIATRWSGPEEYMTDDNSYPLRIEGLEEIGDDGFLQEGRWARPSVTHLRQLMRYVYENPKNAKLKGDQARRDMVEKFCPACVAEIVVEELRDIEKEIGVKPMYSPSFSPNTRPF